MRPSQPTHTAPSVTRCAVLASLTRVSDAPAHLAASIRSSVGEAEDRHVRLAYSFLSTIRVSSQLEREGQHFHILSSLHPLVYAQACRAEVTSKSV